MAQKTREIGAGLDRFAAARKEASARNQERAAATLRKWAAGKAGGESLAEAARTGRWSGWWAIMESRKAEILRILAGCDNA